MRRFALLETGGNIVKKLVKPGTNFRFVTMEELFDVKQLQGGGQGFVKCGCIKTRANNCKSKKLINIAIRGAIKEVKVD